MALLINKPLVNWINFWVFLFSFSVIALDRHGGEASIILLLTMLYVFFKNDNNTKHQLSTNEIIFITLIILFWLLNILNILFQPEGLEYENNRIRLSAMDNPMRWLLMLPIFFLFRRYKIDWRVISLGLSAGVFISVGIAVYEVYFLDYARAFGGMNHAITFGEIMVAVDLLLWVFMIFAWKNGYRLLSAILLVASLVAFYGSLLSVTRGAWLTYFIMIISLFVYTLQRNIFNKKSLFSKPVLLRILLAFIIFFLVSQTSQYNTIQSRTSDTVKYVVSQGSSDVWGSEGLRIDLFRTALEVARNFPYGVGANNFQNGAKAIIILNTSNDEVNNKVVDQDNNLLDGADLTGGIHRYKSLSMYTASGALIYTSRYDHAHNEWLNVLAENGIAGLILLTLLFIFPIKIFWQNLGHENDLVGMYSYCGILLTISFAIFGQTESIFSSHTIIIFYIFFLYLFFAQISRLTR